ncbi:MAG: hypothetical protein CSA68_12345 [Rhodobacterales bacterium]|nr:MAG: hypothetical protein CSA68_12345 [Rhodobacterales bacterium]
MVFNNLTAAFRISLLLYLVQVAVGVYFSHNYGAVLVAMQMSASMGVPMAAPDGFWLALGLMILVNTVTGLWIAISWHRYILLQENDGGVIPAFHGGALLSYFGKSLGLGVLLGLAYVLIGLALGQFFGIALVQLGVFAVLIYVFYRLALVLPAVAIGQSMSLSQSWEKTAEASGVIAQLSLIAIGFIVLTQIPQMLDSAPTSVISMIYSYVLGWIIMMVASSVLTTLYGVYVEGRRI